jgi:hypothetical protein
MTSEQTLAIVDVITVATTASNDQNPSAQPCVFHVQKERPPAEIGAHTLNHFLCSSILFPNTAPLPYLPTDHPLARVKKCTPKKRETYIPRFPKVQ